MDTLVEILRNPAGFVVEVCGLYVSRLRSGNYHVRCVREGEEFDELVPDAWLAAKLFMQKREELHLGYDIEDKSNSCVGTYLG